MSILHRLLSVAIVLGLATLLTSDASAQCSTVNRTCDFACSVLKYARSPVIPTPIAESVAAVAALGFVEGDVRLATATQPVGQTNVAFVRLGIPSASLPWWVCVSICRGLRVAAAGEAEARDLRHVAADMVRRN
jgi:hypothetical protein